MKRRNFISLALTSMGALGVPLSARVFAQATEGILPIGIAVADSPRGRIVTRVYPGNRRREVVIMMRTAQGDEFRRMTLPQGIMRLSRRFLQEGAMPLRVVDVNEDGVDLDFTMSGQAPNISFDYRIGNTRGSGQTAGGDDDGGGGTTQGLSPLGFLLAVFAMAFALAAYAIHEGASLKLRFRCDTGFEPGCESEIQVGNPMDDDTDNFIADESCEGLPPLPC
jgi:hypothetical protein